MKTLYQIKEILYSLDSEKWKYNFLNHKVNDNFFKLFGNSNWINVYDESLPYDLTLEVFVDTNNIINKIDYYKVKESQAARPTTKYLDLNKRDVSRIIKILSTCVIIESEEIFNSLKEIKNGSENSIIENETKNEILLNINNKHTVISKNDLFNYINISFNYNEIISDKDFWKINELNIDHFEIFRYLYSQIDKKYYCIEKLNEEESIRNQKIKDFENASKLKQAIKDNDDQKIIEYKNSIEYLDLSEITITKLSNRYYKNKNIELLLLFSSQLNGMWYNNLIDKSIKSKDSDILDELLKYRNDYQHSNIRFNWYDYNDNIECLNSLFKHNIKWPEDEYPSYLPKNFFEILEKIDISSVNFDAVANDLIKINRYDVLLNAIKYNALKDYHFGQKMIKKIQLDDNVEDYNLVYNYFKDKLFEINKNDGIPDFIKTAVENPVKRVNQLIIKSIKNKKILLTLQINDMVIKQKPIECIKKFIIENNFGINDYIMTQMIDFHDLLLEKGSPYIDLILEYYDDKYNIDELNLKKKAYEIARVYIINNLLDEEYGDKFDLKRSIFLPYLTALTDLFCDQNNLRFLENKYKEFNTL